MKTLLIRVFLSTLLFTQALFSMTGEQLNREKEVAYTLYKTAKRLAGNPEPGRTTSNAAIEGHIDAAFETTEVKRALVQGCFMENIDQTIAPDLKLRLTEIVRNDYNSHLQLQDSTLEIQGMAARYNGRSDRRLLSEEEPALLSSLNSERIFGQSFQNMSMSKNIRKTDPANDLTSLSDEELNRRIARCAHTNRTEEYKILSEEFNRRHPSRCPCVLL